jgi:hypothetical protein
MIEHSFRSFLWNLRTLGPLWWLRCAIVNSWRSIWVRPAPVIAEQEAQMGNRCGGQGHDAT